MNRGARMLLQLFAPALIVAVSGPIAGTVLLQMATYSLWRLWRWERGLEPQCPCGGLLSRPSTGRRGRSDRIRHCLGCRRPQSALQPDP
jgi:hypothetical protein